MTSDTMGNRAKSMKMAIPEASTFADALDSLCAGLFLVEATSRIVHANASACAMLHRRSVLRAVNNKLVACDAGSAQALTRVVASVANAIAGTQSISLPLRASDGEHCVAHVLALTPGTHRRSAVRGAALVVHKVVLELPQPEAIAGLYGLTPTELRVLLAIVEVGNVRETAAVLGIGEATVKTHLHRVFGKTGATRQADLVKLVAGFANPVVGRSPPPLSAAVPPQPFNRCIHPEVDLPAAPLRQA